MGNILSTEQYYINSLIIIGNSIINIIVLL